MNIGRLVPSPFVIFFRLEIVSKMLPKPASLGNFLKASTAYEPAGTFFYVLGQKFKHFVSVSTIFVIYCNILS